ncbi:MAG: alpha/beta hydrolase [Thalassolituus maritimus]|uniref:Lysophospholipase, alpha-beta hydrolase superfamily n=1 Tax=Thalassolituus maritimus TaxID=484498 RepID=A0A1N7PNV3_9GAMM|nr:MAG: alpha/beta hydrolase [Thalassolituus maritimus]SIT12157.1 Lysophospholipase, alpha-beta hydrolase superfamily [Thalassolituus maritimus]
MFSTLRGANVKELTYRNHSYWKNYLKYFPEALRRMDAEKIQEEWWRWGRSDIHLDRYVPTNDVQSPVKAILLHGGGGYSRLLAPYAQSLCEEGHEVVVPDLPGFGLTRADVDDIDYRRWVALVIDLIKREAELSEAPVFVMGASLGGMVAYAVSRNNPDVRGVIATTLCNPEMHDVREAFVRSPWIARYLWPLSRLIPGCVAQRIKLPIKWFGKMKAIANNPDLSLMVSKDKLGGGRCLPLSFLDSIFRLQPPSSLSGDAPVLLIHPAEDVWTPVALSDHFFAGIPGRKFRVILPECGHYPIEEEGLSVMKTTILKFISSECEN